MSSYYPSFQYRGLNSLKDKNLIVVAFDPDQGEMDTFLGMEAIYTDKFDGSRRLDYGAKYNNVSLIKISVIKCNMSDFTMAEVRDFLKWTTGARQVSYLDMMIDDEIKFSLLGRVVNAYQQKLDARTVGMAIEFESVSPWAYSPVQTISCSFGGTLTVDTNGVVMKKSSQNTALGISKNGTLSNGPASSDTGGGVFKITSDGAIYIDNTTSIRIDNPTDDLDSFINMNVVFENSNSTYLSIHNTTLNEKTEIKNMAVNEVVTINAGQFIFSDNTSKLFGNSFNYVWPRLVPGVNKIIVSGDGMGVITLTYRYPMKIGDCAIDIGNFDGECRCGDNTDYGTINWKDIVGEPDTLAGYGIKDTYTAKEIDEKIANAEIGGGSCDCDINENELNQMLENILN